MGPHCIRKLRYTKKQGRNEEDMSKYTRKDIIRMVEEEDVEFIRLQFVDVCGTLKNMAVTAAQLIKILNNQCTFDGAAIDGFTDYHKSELFLAPDLDTFTIFPWRPQQGKVARFLCDVRKADGAPFEGDSRYVLKKVIQEAEEMGYTFQVGPECEFFLFDMDSNGEPTTNTSEKGGYFDVGPVDSGENARREMVLFLEEMGFEVENSYHAKVPGQHKIDFKYDNALSAADNIVTFKMTVRMTARRHGLHATFMPKPKCGVNGSGMHISMSLAGDGRNIFDGDNGNPSQEAYAFAAGILDHIEGLTAICNPIVNSYKRLVPGYYAPAAATWSESLRNALIRIAALGSDGTKVELRSPDGASNPYLVLAVCLAAGLDGIRNKKKLKESQKGGLNQENALPPSLEAATNALLKDSFIRQVLGEYITKKYTEAKKAEWNEYCSQVTQWELDSYLLRI